MPSDSAIQRLPIEVDPYKLVEQGRLFEGRIPQKDFPRIQDQLYSDSDEDNSELIKVHLEFTRTENHLPVIKGQIKAQFNMVCSRCLESTALQINAELAVVLVNGDEEAQRLQDSCDIWLVEDQKIFLRDFIEDEILLAMPLVISHDSCEPARKLVEALPEEMDNETQQKENPFAALKDLKLN